MHDANYRRLLTAIFYHHHDLHHYDLFYPVCVFLSTNEGKKLVHVLMLMRTLDEKTYASLARRIQEYAACIGVVDTGYFRKRSVNAGCDVNPEFVNDMCYLLAIGPGQDSQDALDDYVALKDLCARCQLIDNSRLAAGM